MTTSQRSISRPTLYWSIGIVAAILLGVGLFQILGISVFNRIGMPHEFCYLQDPKLVWLHVSSDFLIGCAYVSISLTLAYLVFRASKGIPFHWVFLAFGLFIISCGLTHFMEIWVIWQPLYWLSGYLKIITAAASVATALALFPLIPKVLELVEAARKSEARKVEIEQLNQELERFNYSVAHDLRAPLRGIAGFSEALREDLGESLSPTNADYLNRMQRSASRMDTLISDLLRYAVIGRQEIILAPVDLTQVLKNATELLAEEIGARKAEVIAVGVLPPVIGDATLMQVIFQNLIGNALKFVAPGTLPRVQISARTSPNGSQVTLFFNDNGIGIPAQVGDQIFGMFQRLHPEIPGSGMGLRIVHRAVERQGGKIGINAGPNGTGSQFWLELPAAR